MPYTSGPSESIGKGFLRFPKDLLVGDFEHHIGCWLRNGNSWEDSLRLDLSEVTWIDVPALLHLAALIGQRVENGLETILHLPRSKRVRDFLRLWRFQVGIREITGLALCHLVSPEDLQYFGEAQDTYRSTESGAPTDQIVMELSRKRYFGLVGHRIEGTAGDEQVIRKEWDRWRGHLVMHVLDSFLKERGHDVARVIVYEAMANSLQHPSADLLAAVSKVDATALDGAGERSDRMLTLSFWDNGQSIIETLGGCLRAGLPIRTSVNKRLLGDKILARFKVNGSPVVEEVFSLDWTPNRHSDASHVLLASVFPGVTRKVGRDVPVVSSADFFEEKSSGKTNSGPGMGLSALVRTAVDELKGSIAIRTGSHFMNVRTAGPKLRKSLHVRYQAKILQHGREIPSFPGNMVTIRIPLRTFKTTK